MSFTNKLKTVNNLLTLDPGIKMKNILYYKNTIVELNNIK